MWSDQVISMMIQGIWETIYMTVISTFAGYVIGLPMGIALTVTDKDGSARMRQFIRSLM